MLGMYFNKRSALCCIDSDVIFREVGISVDNSRILTVLVKLELFICHPINFNTNSSLTYSKRSSFFWWGWGGLCRWAALLIHVSIGLWRIYPPAPSFESVAHSHAHPSPHPSSVPCSLFSNLSLSVCSRFSLTARSSPPPSHLLISCSLPRSPGSDGERDAPGNNRTRRRRICEVGIPLN